MSDLEGQYFNWILALEADRDRLVTHRIDDAATIKGLQSLLTIATEHVRKMQITNGSLTGEIDKLKGLLHIQNDDISKLKAELENRCICESVNSATVTENIELKEKLAKLMTTLEIQGVWTKDVEAHEALMFKDRDLWKQKAERLAEALKGLYVEYTGLVLGADLVIPAIKAKEALASYEAEGKDK